MATGYQLIDYPNPNAAQGTHPRRGGARLSGTCVVHTSESGWTAGVDALTRFVRTRTDYGSYHRACDWSDITLYYPWEWEAWQDSETNNWAVGIAAACRASDWAVMPADIREGYYRNLARMAADFVTYMHAEHGVIVPLRRISGAEARARVPGFCAHGDSGLHRSDPGADFDWAALFRYTAAALGAPAIGFQNDNITAVPTPPAAAPKPKMKEWYEMPIPKSDLDAIARAVHHAQLPLGGKGTVSHEMRIIMTDRLANQTLKQVASQDAQIKGLVGAIAALSKGEPFDQAKLLSGVQAAASAGVAEVIDSVTRQETTTVKVKGA